MVSRFRPIVSTLNAHLGRVGTVLRGLTPKPVAIFAKRKPESAKTATLKYKSSPIPRRTKHT